MAIPYRLTLTLITLTLALALALALALTLTLTLAPTLTLTLTLTLTPTLALTCQVEARQSHADDLMDEADDLVEELREQQEEVVRQARQQGREVPGSPQPMQAIRRSRGHPPSSPDQGLRPSPLAHMSARCCPLGRPSAEAWGCSGALVPAPARQSHRLRCSPELGCCVRRCAGDPRRAQA